MGIRVRSALLPGGVLVGVLAGLDGAALVAGCNRIAETNAGKAVLDAADSWHKNAQRLLTSRDALAPEYPASAISPFFRGNGSTDPQNGDYPRHVEEGFANWRLEVTGLVANPLSLSLDDAELADLVRCLDRLRLGARTVHDAARARAVLWRYGT